MKDEGSMLTIFIVTLILAAATALIILVATQVVRMPRPNDAINLYSIAHIKALEAQNKEMP